MPILLQIAENLLLLSFMGLGYFFIERYRDTIGCFNANLLIALCLGLTAALVTATPVTLGDGATVDARAGPVILAGIVAGPIGALFAALLGGLARGIVGGNFAISGTAVYGVYALTGLAVRHFGIVTKDSLPKLRSVGIVVFGSVCGASAMFFLISPLSRAIQWLQEDLPFILVANTLSVIFSAAMLGVAIIFLKKSAEVIAVNDALALAKRAGRFGIWDYDIGSGKLAWDERSKELHGVESEAFEGTFEDWASNVHPDDLQETIEAFEKALANEKSFDTEYRVLLPDGTVKSIKGDAIVIRDRSGQAVRVVGSNIDLTNIRATEAKLADARALAFQAQKNETIGQLTGGVAHDFNNLLAVIMGNMELLRIALPDHADGDQEVDQYIRDSFEAAKRGADLTRNMLAYARKAQLKPVQVDLNSVVEQTEKWMRRTIESSVEIQTVLQPGLWATHVDESSLQSALVNLLVNARDAIDGSGRVTIETRNVHLNEQFVRQNQEDVMPGRYVMLSVDDDGAGMAQDDMERIFDPFFTTKPVGQGTGLGLSMVHGFVKQSRGTIRVESEPGAGARFRLYFPAVPSSASGIDPLPRGDRSSGASAEPGTRILLVEDQGEVRTVLERMLTSGGFDVVTAISGDDAFRLFERDKDFALVITDVVMPGALQGLSLANKIRESCPGMAFLFLSGYATDAAIDGSNLLPGDRWVGKPVSQEELLGAVQECLMSSPR